MVWKVLYGSESMTGASGPLGRDSMSFLDRQRKYHGEILRNVDAAEMLCPNKGAGECIDGCVFRGDTDPMSEWWCKLGGIRAAIGDIHIAVPPCQCGGDCGCRRHQE